MSIQKGLDSRLVELSRYPILINRYARKPYQIEAGKLWTNQLDCLYQLAARGFWVEGFSKKNLLLLILTSGPTER